MADDFGNPFAGMDPWTLRNLPLLQMAGQFGAGMLQGASAPPGERATFGRALGQGMQQGMGGMLQGVEMSRKIGQDQAWRQAVQSAPQEYRGVLSSLGPQHGAAMLGPLLAEQKNQQGLLNFGGGGGQPMPPTPSMPPMPQAAGGGGGGGGGGFMDRLAASEGGTGPGANTAQNPRSSATGPYQFINSTWRDFAKNNPQQFGGLDDAEVLSARSNPQAARQGAQWYAQQGANTLQQGGADVTPTNLALHHRFGPQGAMAILKAQPEAPLANVLPPQVLQANPDLAGQTAGGLLQNVQRRFGGGGGQQQGAPAGPDGSAIMLPNGSRPATWADITRAQMDSNPQVRQWGAGAMQLVQASRQSQQEQRAQAMDAHRMGLDETRVGLDAQRVGMERERMDRPGETERMIARRAQLVARKDMLNAEERAELEGITQSLPHGTNVNVLPQEKAEQKGTGETLAQEFAEVRTAGNAAAQTLDTIRSIRAIPAETGRLAPLQEFVGGHLAALGVKGGEAVKQATNLQTLNSITKNFTLGKQAEQKGVQTADDARRIDSTIAQTTNTMEANDIILRHAAAQSIRMMEKDRFYQDWRQQPGPDGQPRNTVDGAGQAWQQNIRQTPMVVRQESTGRLMFFNEFMEKAVPQVNGNVGAALEAWREYAKGGK